MTLHAVQQSLIVFVTMSAVMALLWLRQRRTSDAGIVDVDLPVQDHGDTRYRRACHCEPR